MEYGWCKLSYIFQCYYTEISKTHFKRNKNEYIFNHASLRADSITNHDILKSQFHLAYTYNELREEVLYYLDDLESYNNTIRNLYL